MCGIFGTVNYAFKQSDLNLLKHRGPDDFGIEDMQVNGTLVRFGHRRLSILDLTPSGHQPFLSECGNYMIIFNGEIYNHKELREKLSNGINFKGHSDTETILYYIAKFGIESVADFNGIFALSFFNKKEGRLYLVRDKFGVKPLYHYCDGKRILFSSEIRPINKILRTSVDTDALNLILNLRYCPSPSTLFKDIRKLRPGHYADIDLSKNELQLTIKTFIRNYRRPLEIPFGEAVIEYGNLLEKAVERQLMSDVEVGLMLSGGIDSAIVAGIAANKLKYKPKAFTIGFDSNYAVNEIDTADETAKYFGLEHYTQKINSDDFFKLFENCSRIVEEPIATTSFIPMYYLSKLASEHVKVVLTGQGADEPLGGYGRYQGEVYHEMFPRFIFNIASLFVKLAGTKNDQLIRGAKSLSIINDVERFTDVYSLFNSKEIQLLTGYGNITSSEFVRYYYNLMDCSSLSNSAERMMLIDMQMNLADDLLLYTDKITMNFSLECRVPMLDLPLVDFLTNLPQSYKVKLGKTKIIHREYARTFLPDSIIKRPKYGFQTPTDIWFRREYGQISEILLSNSNLALNFFNKAVIEKVLEMHKKGFNKEKQIFMLLSLSHWFNSLKN